MAFKPNWPSRSGAHDGGSAKVPIMILTVVAAIWRANRDSSFEPVCLFSLLDLTLAIVR